MMEKDKVMDVLEVHLMYLREKIDHIDKKTDVVVVEVKKTNGRVTKLEQNEKNLATKEELSVLESKYQSGDDQENLANIKGKWSLMNTVITGICTVIVAILTYLVTKGLMPWS